MKRSIVVSAGLAAVCASLVARAQEPEDAQADAEPAAPAATKPAAPNPEEAEAGDEDTFGHARQFNLRAALLGGYRMVFRYDESPFCSEFEPSKQLKDQQKFCGHASPLALDLALGFAPLDSIEPFVWGRFGLQSEAETDTNPIVIVGLGVRIYTMSDSKLKVFIEPAVGAELEGWAGNELWQRNNPDYKKDLVFHLAAGPQFDIAKAFGIYLDAGLTTGILRSIHTTLELAIGIQGRAP